MVPLLIGGKKKLIKNKVMGYKSDAQRKAVHASKAEKSGLKAKSPYMMYDKKSGVMMSESPIMKKCGSKRYGKKK